MIKIIITENQGNQRLDRFIKKYFDQAPLSYIYKLIRKDIKVNGKRSKEDAIIQPGDELIIHIGEEEAQKLQKPKNIPLKHGPKAKKQFKIAYEDRHILVCEKPYGLLTHGDQTEKRNHLANQVVDYLIEKGEYQPRVEKTFTPAPANRLDRNTTGLVVFGKNALALQELNQMIRQQDAVRKLYMTIVCGNLKQGVRLRAKMMKDESKNLVSVLDENSEEGKVMETVARPLQSGMYNGKWYTLVEVEIITGRTHQIRAHLAKAGYPVIGDVKYGNRGVNQQMQSAFGLSTQLLHAYRLVFERTRQDGVLAYLQGKTVETQLPLEFQRIKDKIFDKN